MFLYLGGVGIPDSFYLVGTFGWSPQGKAQCLLSNKVKSQKVSFLLLILRSEFDFGVGKALIS